MKRTIQQDLVAILNALNKDITTGKRFITHMVGEEMRSKLVNNKTDSPRILRERARVAINKGENVSDEVLQALKTWDETSNQRGTGWEARFDGVYRPEHKKTEWDIKRLLSEYNSGLDESVFDGIKWLGGDEDQYYTPHIYNIKGGRRADNVRFLTCLYVDIDEVTVQEAGERLAASTLPDPSMVINSGGGVHVYWFFSRPAIANGEKFCYVNTWRKLATHFTNQLKGDRQCVDIARLLRIPGTINTKRGVKGELLYFNPEITYDIDELRLEYTPPKAKQSTIPENKRTYKAKAQNGVTLTKDREFEDEAGKQSGYNKQVKEDLLTLVELRRGDIEGYRHNILFYYKRFGADLQELHAMNALFSEPVSENSIKHTAKGKGIKGKRPRRATMMEMLQITPEESEHLKQLVPAYVINSRKALRRLEEGFIRVYTAYSGYLNTLYAQAGTKTPKEKAEFLLLTKRHVNRLAQVKLSGHLKMKQELVDSLDGLVDIAVDVLEVIEMSKLNETELAGYYQDITAINNKLNTLNQVIAEGQEYVNGGARIRVLESKIKQLQVLAA